MIRKLIRRVFDLPGARSRQGIRPKIYPVTQHGVHRDRLSFAALKITTRLQEAGFQAYVVGGAVRDLMLGVDPKDFDVATNATPEEVHHLFRRSRIIGRRFRIVHVMVGPETIEVTTFRGGEVGDKNETGRIMADNTYGSQEEDAHRRDFTVNALFYDPSDETVIDYHHGVKDLNAKKLVMIGQPARRYQEDPVRMLRAVRLAAKLGFEIDEATQKPIRSHAHLLKNEPPARLFDELLKLLHSGQGFECLKKLSDEGLSHGNFPLLAAVMDEPGSEAFVKLALDSTDARIRADKPVSVGFLLATMLWHQVYNRWQRRVENGEKSVGALLEAMADVEALQDNDFAIPRRFSTTMREIWMLQPRFESRSGQRPFRFLEQPRFRAAYDFLALRAEVGEVDRELVDWWTRFQSANDDTRLDMIANVKDDGPRAGAQRKRRRRKKAPGAADGQGSGA
ncbi:polynucleotide adenylyltransferase PcnB [Crenobacter cavernae]|uniref:Poly(A) polymerase I n=1 Tax=Crenobacter cavernae TaxID=2290923 RepID=A0ABY0FAG9_9NEIS|nr:polynucleotide adenylyltransferase PcnB [Crenobacter cavernae]RXZ42460.1 polynucleotide adenylyltransferase PcnB [Crenobacter cavernae]